MLVKTLFKKNSLAGLAALLAVMAALLVAAFVPGVCFADDVEVVIDESAGKPDAEALQYDWTTEEHAQNAREWAEVMGELDADSGIATFVNREEGTASDIVSVALSQADGRPSGGNSNKYNNYNGEPWCAYFVVWCARQAGVSSAVIPARFECSNLASYYKGNGRWHSTSYTPKPGDLIFYSQWSGGTPCHVGFVTSVSGSRITTKEGNTTGGVISSRQRTVGSSYVASGWYVVGYASPNYAAHTHRYDTMKDISYAPHASQDVVHVKSYTPTCDCGASAAISKENERCTWRYANDVYSCTKCLRQYDIEASSNHYRLFADVVSSVSLAGGVENVWYVSGGWLEYAVENSLVAGVNSAKGCLFQPNTAITRAQAVAILHNATGKPAASALSDFTDVAKGDWFAGAVAWASEAGVVAGYENGSFRPNAKVTRQELAVMLTNYVSVVLGEDCLVEEGALDVSVYVDWDAVAEWAQPAMAWCLHEGIVAGRLDSEGNTLISPSSKATRAETVTLVAKCLMSLDGEASEDDLGEVDPPSNETTA